MPYQIKWKGLPRPDLEAALRADLASVEDDLGGDMGGLISHICCLTRNIEGPSISAMGDPGTGGIVAEYHDTTEWISMADLGVPQEDVDAAVDNITRQIAEWTKPKH